MLWTSGFEGFSGAQEQFKALPDAFPDANSDSCVQQWDLELVLEQI